MSQNIHAIILVLPCAGMSTCFLSVGKCLICVFFFFQKKKIHLNFVILSPLSWKNSGVVNMSILEGCHTSATTPPIMVWKAQEPESERLDSARCLFLFLVPKSTFLFKFSS